MSDALAKMMGNSERAERVQKRKKANENKRHLSPEEEGALAAMRREARAAGVKLDHNGEGGLPPSLVLHVMRRDGYRCKIHGGRDVPLTVHHKSGIVEGRWAAKKGHSMAPNNIVTLCVACHNRIHEKAREEGVDSSQLLPEADIGTKHDKGQPVLTASGKIERGRS